MTFADCSSPQKPSKTRDELLSEKINVAPFACERLAKTQLKDPDSYQRIDVTARMTNPDSGYDYTAHIKGRAKNGLGGYVETAFSCQFKFGSDNVLVKQLY